MMLNFLIQVPAFIKLQHLSPEDGQAFTIVIIFIRYQVLDYYKDNVRGVSSILNEDSHLMCYRVLLQVY